MKKLAESMRTYLKQFTVSANCPQLLRSKPPSRLNLQIQNFHFPRRGFAIDSEVSHSVGLSRFPTND